MTRAAWVCAVALVACRSSKPPQEHVGTVQGPPLLATPLDASAQDAGASARDAGASPVTARFVDLPTKDALGVGACEQGFFAVARGSAKAAGETLAATDVLVVRGKALLDVGGEGLALFATIPVDACDPSDAAAMTKTVMRGAKTPDLAFAGGAMHAHLDVEGVPFVYFGRLDGTAPVAEHVHEAAWEILAAVEGAGTFTLDGAEHRLGPKQVVMVPPATKHAWRPDPGVRLVAFQMYTPAGPEQRFKSLADAGAKK